MKRPLRLIVYCSLSLALHSSLFIVLKHRDVFGHEKYEGEEGEEGEEGTEGGGEDFSTDEGGTEEENF